jgi:Ca2+-transporting ATPase
MTTTTKIPPTRPEDSPAPLWHTLPAETVLARLASGPEGLTQADADERLATYGPNELQSTIGVSAWAVLASQFKNVLILILLVATLLSAVMGHGTEAVAIAAIVLLAVLLGFVQEYRAERATEALRRFRQGRWCPATSSCSAPAIASRPMRD